MPKDDLLSFDYEPLIFLRCHSKTDNDSADVRTQIWQVAFNPNRLNSIATCGGNKVCIIDPSIQKVEQRYSAKNKEILYALMWLNKPKSDVLVVGGYLGILYFINPELKTQVAHFAVPKSLKSNIFSLSLYPSSMSSGDIHLVDADVQFSSSRKIHIIASFSCHHEITRTAFCPYSSTLFAASSTGLYGWSTCIQNYEEWENKLITFNLRMDSNNPKAEEKIVDSIEILDDGYVASKYALDSFIFIWHVQHGIVEANSKSRIIEIVPFYKLIWCKTDNYYMEISANCDLGLLTCGDAQGKIWFYDIRYLRTDHHESSEKTKTIKAFNILDWPQVEDIHHAKSKKLSLENDDIVIGKAIVSPNGKYCVAITDRNIVCLWSKM